MTVCKVLICPPCMPKTPPYRWMGFCDSLLSPTKPRSGMQYSPTTQVCAVSSSALVSQCCPPAPVEGDSCPAHMPFSSDLYSFCTEQCLPQRCAWLSFTLHLAFCLNVTSPTHVLWLQPMYGCLGLLRKACLPCCPFSSLLFCFTCWLSALWEPEIWFCSLLLPQIQGA